jgi:uncharacterized low-complexity protein
MKYARVRGVISIRRLNVDAVAKDSFEQTVRRTAVNTTIKMQRGPVAQRRAFLRSVLPVAALLALALGSAPAFAQTAPSAASPGCTAQKAGEGEGQYARQKAGEGEGQYARQKAGEGEGQATPQKAGEGEGQYARQKAGEGEGQPTPQRAAAGAAPCKG